MLFLLLCGLVPLAHAARCTVTSPILAFGTYDAVSGAPVTSSASMTISCTGGRHKNHAVVIALSAGSYSGGSFSPRLMQNTAASDTLAYNLYVDTSYAATSVWGDGTAGTQTETVTTGTGNPATAMATVNGQIPASQDPLGVCPTTPCNYSDSVVITITF